ncbi:hypothetical protein AB4Z01_11450 [Inquilinus sp. YAF38]|uniref:hypothetical protein n=1 Tax=Inquilinus sp. YAF38 TaxID=3233084 RepID=UPI003F93CC0D
MRHAQGTGTPLPRPTPAAATGVTAAICGFAILSLVAVLGFSLASDAADGTGNEAPVHLLTRPAIIGAESTVLATASPFDAPGCVAMAATQAAQTR